MPTTRDDESAIAEQMLARRYDVLMGGGSRFFDNTLLATRPDLHVLRSAKDVAAWEGQREGRASPLLGIFTGSHMSFDIDRVHAALDEPSLADMVRVSLEHLTRLGGAEGFVMQVEGGRVDHGGHYNDAAGLIYDLVAFDNAVKVAMDYADAHPDTLLMITADHATGNPGLTEYGPKGIDMFQKVLGFRHTFEWLEKKLGGKRTLDGGEPPEFLGANVVKHRTCKFTPDEMADLTKEASGLDLATAEIDMLVRWREGEVVSPFGLGNSRFGPLGSVLANHTAVAFLSPNHTADPVELTAVGPGSAALPQRLAINEIHKVMVEAMGLAAAKPA